MLTSVLSPAFPFALDEIRIIQVALLLTLPLALGVNRIITVALPLALPVARPFALDVSGITAKLM